ncbi:Zn-dependent protease [Flavobacterium pectinovorum]|uniref:Zn-dependent protease n=1 Tax=Flavobacterium pectinovorum TaxID=29533 RepID=UPI00265E1657|nr:Zn-dependent protease [Flavobacterium pectinovorum]WKL50281.1 Zn-dependent protease [Flavobacterium pectinovorum]
MKYFAFLLLFSVLSCTNGKNENNKENQKTIQKVIVIQPLGNFKVAQAKKVFSEIKMINPNLVLRKNIDFPENSYYKLKNRYRADSIIKSLKSKIGEDSVIVGLSNLDISTTKNRIKDWGVMGLGYKPGKACVVSDFRLSHKNKNQQFYKLVLHELGHTAGLPHCAVKTCLMRDAEGGNPLDEEKDFCNTCKSFLKTKGWQLI